MEQLYWQTIVGDQLDSLPQIHSEREAILASNDIILLFAVTERKTARGFYRQKTNFVI